MPRPAALLFLLIALAGPLLTHAEAADDLARALIGVQDRGRIEAPDGGVGDDPNVASVGRAAQTVDTLHVATPAWDSPPSASPLDFPSIDPSASLLRRSRCASWPFPTAPRRAAWLQVYLY